MESRSDRRASLPSELRPNAWGRAGGSRHSSDGKERKATPSEEAAAVRSAKQLHVHQPGIVFVPGAKLQVQETIDNNWYDCKVVEVDWGELDILVHYQRWSDRFDEWLKMDSPRIRPVPAPRGPEQCPFHVGDSVVALWSVDHRYYPATVTRVINAQQCEVKFRDDNITKVLRCSQVHKLTGKEPASLLAPTRALAPPTVPAALPAAAAPPPAEGTSRKNIFDVNICDEKRKPKRKAEYTEMMEGMHKRRSLQGLISTRSTRQMSEKPPPLPCARVAPSTSSSSSTASSTAEASSAVAPPAPTASLPSSLATAAAASSASTSTSAPTTPRNSVTKAEKNISSKFPTPKRLPPPPLVIDNIDLTSSPDKGFKLRTTGANPTKEPNEFTRPVNEESPSARDSDAPKCASHLSSQSSSVSFLLPEKDTTVQPELKQSQQLLVTPKRATTTRPTALQLEVQHATHAPKLAKPVSTQSPLASKLSIKKNKAIKTPGSAKPSLLASLSTTRRAPMADDCMLSWEKHGCSVVKENSFPGWTKQYSRRQPYTGQDSWDAAYFAPDGSVLRNKRDLSAYAEDNALPCLVASFDFTAAGVKDAMLEHMKVCSVGTTKVGMSRTVALPSSSAPLTPTLPSSPIKTRSSGMSHKKSDTLAPETQTPSSSSYLSTQFTKSCPSTCPKDMPETCNIAASSREIAPVDDDYTHSLILDDSLKKLPPPPLLSPPPTIPPPPHSPPAPPSPPPHLPVQSSPVASVSERKERETSAPSRTVSAVVSAGVDAAHAATAAVLQDEEHEAGVCSGESDEDNEQDVLSPQSQPNILTQTKVGLEDTNSSPAVPETPRRSVHLAPPGRFKIEIPIVLGRETSELERDVETPQPLTKSLPRTPPADAKSTPRSRLGAARRETKFVDSPSVSLEEHVCVVKNCNKTFRKHSLLQMHMKHYHPGTGDRLGSVPNVADLAYARTALGLLESGKTPSTDRRRKRHSLASPPESKRRKLEAVSRRKSTATLDAMEESDVGSVDTDSVDTRRVDLAHDSDWTADQESLAGDSSAAAALADQKFPVLDSESDEESDFVGFPSAPLPKTAPSPPSSHSLQRADAVDQSASADEGTSEESDEEATDVADEGDEVNVEDETGHRHIINCCCGSVEEDGLMLQCDVCMCWQHAQCYAIGKKAVPEKYVCSMCTNPDLVRSNHRFDHQVRNWLKEGAIPKFSFSSDDVGGGAQLEASVQRGHELSGALLQHSHLLHAVSVILAIAKKADHPKLVMWHKKWSDPRPPGFVPSILPLLPPPSTLQPFLPQVSGSLFPHSSSLTKDEAALIRDIIDMEPLMPPDKVLMQPDSMFGGVASLLPDSACIIGPPASVLNSSEMPPDGGRSSSPSLVLPRTPAPLTFPCEAPGFSTCSLPTSLLGSASFESLTSSSPGLSTSVKSTPVCSSNVFPSLSTAVSIINSFSASLPDVSTTNSLTSTDKLPSFPMASSDFSSPTVHASASSSITDSTLTSIISTKIPTLPSPCNMSNEVISKSSAPSSMPINLSADASAMLPMEVRDESIPPVPSPSLSAVVDSVSVSTSSSSPTCSSVLSVSGPPISEPYQLTGDVSNSNTSRALHPVSSKEFVSTSVLSSATPDESDPIRDSLTSGYSDSVHLTSRPDSLSQNFQEVRVSNLVDQTALKVKDLNTPVSQTENIYDNKFTVEDSDNLKISEGVADEKLLSSKKDFPLETEKLSDETVKLPSEMSSRISEQQIVKKESFNANSKALYKSDVDEIKPINVNISEEEKISSSFGYDEFESLKVTPEKECSFKLSKDDKSPDKREVSFDLHLNLSSSEKGENSIIDEEVEAKSVKICSLDVKTPRAEEIDDRLLPGAIPGSNHSVAEHGGASNALDICPAASVNQTTKASTSFTTVNAAEVSVISSPTSFGTIGMINSVTASSNIKSETHNEAPLIDVPNSISNDGEIQSTCSTLVHDLTYSSNSETTNNPETVTGTDGTENLYLGENADLDTSDLGLDLNELLLGNAAPSLDQFGIPNLTPGQTTHDIPGPSVPFPEAERIEPVKCKLNLLSHVQAAQDTLERVYDVIETEISKLEEQMGIKATEDEDSPGDTTSRQLVQMVLADMNIVERLSLYTG